MRTRTWKAVAAMAKNRSIGLNGAMPWHLPDDMKFFRKLTTGHTVLMGRKTWESLGKPLSNRRNIILSRSMNPPPGAEVVRSVEEVLNMQFTTDVFVIGGAEIYQLLLDQCGELFLTVINAEYPGDTFFPDFEAAFSKMEVLAKSEEAEWRRYWR